MTAIEGVDYAWAPHPSPAALKGAGKHFAVRYGGPGSDGKHLHADEVAALKAAGIALVANAEQAANSFKGTAAGKAHATSADAAFKALGMPGNRPIYFSVDWDADAGDWAAIDAALRGAASVIGAARVGVYGSYDTVSHCHSAGTARWFWQTYAWSGGKTPPSFVHLYQYRNGQKIGGADCDFVRALQDDYGQWGVTTNVGDDDDMTPEELLSYDPNVKGKGIPNPFADAAQNPTVSVMTALYNGMLAQRTLSNSVQPALAALSKTVGAMATAVNDLAGRPVVDEDAIAQQVLAGLGGGGRPAAEIAADLIAALGDNAAAVAQAILDASAKPS
jgi:hypothetical protein